jgi:hypothetical protein
MDFIIFLSRVISIYLGVRLGGPDARVFFRCKAGNRSIAWEMAWTDQTPKG